MNFDSTSVEEQNEPQFRPLTRLQRRIVGVLIEKSKTTPSAYPLTVNAITTGANQKSNRSPQMSVAADDIQLGLDQLREMRAVVEIHGDGRAVKYKHTMYKWLGVDKVEMAVMGELLLRGEQTLGELRARAARMEPIAGLDELRPIVASLIEKDLMVELTPSGRGQIVTHNLYESNEIDHLRSRIGSTAPSTSAATSQPTSQPAPVSAVPSPSELEELRAAIKALTDRVQALEQLINS